MSEVGGVGRNQDEGNVETRDGGHLGRELGRIRRRRSSPSRRIGGTSRSRRLRISTSSTSPSPPAIIPVPLPSPLPPTEVVDRDSDVGEGWCPSPSFPSGEGVPPPALPPVAGGVPLLQERGKQIAEGSEFPSEDFSWRPRVGTSGTAASYPLNEASALDDPLLAREAFQGLLFPADASRVLTRPREERMRDTIRSFIRMALHVNWFFHEDRDHAVQTKRWKEAADTLKARVDPLVAEVVAVTRRAEDAEAALKRVSAENVSLMAARDDLMEEKRKLGVALKVAEEEMKEMDRRRIAAEEEAAKAVREQATALENFKTSKDFQLAKAIFAAEAYKEGILDAQRGFAARFPGADLSFLEAFLTGEDADLADPCPSTAPEDSVSAPLPPP